MGVRSYLLNLTISAIFVLALPMQSYANTPLTFTYQGKLWDATGTTPMTGSFDVTFTILSSDGNCILYEEQFLTLDLTASSGTFAEQIGTGAPTANNPGPMNTLLEVFTNNTTTPIPAFTDATCPTGDWQPLAGSTRLLRITVFDGAVTTVLTPDQVITSVPTAMIAEQLSDIPTEDIRDLLDGSHAVYGNFVSANDDWTAGPYTPQVIGTHGLNVEGVLTSEEDLIINSIGNPQLAIGTSTPAAGVDLQIERQAPTLRLSSTTNAGANSASIEFFGDAAGANLQRAKIEVPDDTNELRMSTGGTTALVLDQNQNAIFSGNITMQASTNLGLGTWIDDTHTVGWDATRLGYIWYNTTDDEIKFWDGAAVQSIGGGAGADHGGLAGLSDDDHSQYALLAGRATGQTLVGGTAASEDLTLDSTAHATKGDIILNPTSGNVGIGLTNPTRKLEVQGGMVYADNPSAFSDLPAAMFRNSVSTGAVQVLAYSDTVAGGVRAYGSAFPTVAQQERIEFFGASGSNGINFKNYDASGDFRWFNNNTEQMRITSGGNVGIGTTNPETKLHVVADWDVTFDRFGTGDGVDLVIRKARGALGAPTNVVDGDFLGGIKDQGYYGGAYRNTAGIGFQVDGVPAGTSVPGAIKFWTTPAGGVGADRMIIDSDGNVGVGTTAPTGKLDIEGGTAYLPAPEAVPADGDLANNQYSIYTSDAADSVLIKYKDASGEIGIVDITAAAAGGDNLGNHTATADLDLAGNDIIRAPSLTGSDASGGDLTLESTSHATKGDVFIQPTLGNVGIRTLTPGRSLEVAGGDGVRFSGTNGNYLEITNGAVFHSIGFDRTIVGGASNDLTLYAGSGNLRLYTSTNERLRIDSAGNVGIGETTPTAVLHLKAGTAAAGTAPLKLTAGVNLTAPEPGAIEYDGTNLFYTDGTSARRTIAISAGQPTVDFSVIGEDDYLSKYDFATNSLVPASVTDNGTTEVRALLPLYLNNPQMYMKVGGSDRLFMHATGGESNIFLGHQSGNLTTTGTLNVAVGNASLLNNTTGLLNVAIGSNSLRTNTTGQQNVAVGPSAMYDNSTGSFNTAVGVVALQKNTAGSNTAFGYAAVNKNTSGTRNTGLGLGTLYENLTGNDNVAIGDNAIGKATNRSGLTAVGGSAQLYTTGTANTAIGFESQMGVNGSSTGGSNTSIGYTSLRAITTGIQNTAVGESALYATTTGSSNIAVGKTALAGNTTGSSNVGIGEYAGLANTTGSGNVFIGNSAGALATGSNKLFIANSNDSTPLIYGDFSTDSLDVNGTFRVCAADGTGCAAVSGGGDDNLGDHTATNDLDMDGNVLLMNGGKVAGTETASGNLTLDSTTHATKGTIILQPDGGNVGIGVPAPTAILNLPAGTAAAGTAPLKLTSGVNLGTPEAGAIEYDGTNLYFTDSGANRRTVATSTALSSYVAKTGDTMSGSLYFTAGGTRNIGLANDSAFNLNLHGSTATAGTDGTGSSVTIRGGSADTTAGWGPAGGDVLIYGGASALTANRGQVLLAYDGASAMGKVAIGKATASALLDVTHSTADEAASWIEHTNGSSWSVSSHIRNSAAAGNVAAGILRISANQTNNSSLVVINYSDNGAERFKLMGDGSIVSLGTATASRLVITDNTATNGGACGTVGTLARDASGDLYICK